MVLECRTNLHFYSVETTCVSAPQYDCEAAAISALGHFFRSHIFAASF